MHLKSLTIQGFKSFPERTVIEFHQGVTAIIGPNGSGKSNVTDAIRWVLGEQSVRTLRGARMEDVIFTGTQSRRAMSYAEVTMTLDNSDGRLPLDYQEIQVSRRLYRSGESEYILNNVTCRLKDILTLFMDTGLGRDGYSIVGQGRVDDVLSHRSEDRRRIFEEASGIVKFKTRKEESERKLQQTEQNLLRINDIIDDLAARIEPLSEQADAARKYLAWRDELKELDVALMLESVDQFARQKKDAEDERRLLLDDLDRADQDLLDLKQDHQTATQKLNTMEQAINDLQSRIGQTQTAISQLQGQLALTEEKQHQQIVLREQSEAEEVQLNQTLGDLSAELDQRQKRRQVLEKQALAWHRQLDEAEAEMAALLATLDRAEKQVETEKIERDQLLERIFETKNQQTETQSQIQLVEGRRRTIALEIREMISERDRLSLQLEEKEAVVQTLRKSRDELEAARDTAKASLTSAAAELDQRVRQNEQDQQALRDRRYRQKTLQDLEHNYEGYGETVRRLLRQTDSEPQLGEGLRGTLGSLIRVEQNYELAVEIALGPAIQNLVTDHEKTAARLIAWLKLNKAGRATFLPIATIRGRRLEDDLFNRARRYQETIGLASDLVDAPSDIREIIDNLLGRVLIVSDLESANKIARDLRYRCRIVTLEGDVIHPGGSMTGGYHQRQGSGVLRRSREIEQLAAAIEQLEKTVRGHEHQIEQYRHIHQDAGRKLAGLEQQLMENHQLLVREETHYQALQQDQERNLARQTMLEEEDHQLQSEKLNIQTEIHTIQSQVETYEQRVAQLRDDIQTRENANREEKEKRNDLREHITDLKVSLNSVQESLQAALEMTERIDREQRTQQERLNKQAQLRQNSQRRSEELDQEHLALQVKIDDLKSRGEEQAEQLAERMEARSQLESEQKDYFDRLEQLGSRITSLQTEISRNEGRISRIDLQTDEIRNRIWETYEMTIQQAEPMRRSISSRSDVSRQIQTLRQSMRDLGDVNLAAVEESRQVSERHHFMVTQRDDIDATRTQLTQVIDELTEAMKTQFLDHFARINENFNDVFSELFGGGMAEVNLEDDDDVLSCGIEIRAQPPGKRLQNLMLLSGGERCLTAIALLFAILRLRPTPFCVLDEVEAALDDANVSRFTDYIRRYADESQFILVTHRKGTMEAADRLYGVTMQERGISKILSMKLSD